jgi:hypothetical protein
LIKAVFAVVGAALGFVGGVLVALALAWFDKADVLACGFVGAATFAGIAYALARRPGRSLHPGRRRIGVAVVGLLLAAGAAWLLIRIIV